MAHHLAPMLRFLRRVTPSDAVPVADAQLLGRFVRSGDEAAFAALVRRYGPMVMRVCRRVLGDFQAAEDAFQATFLVLARKARAIRRPDALVGWLYGVAHRVALKARSVRARHPCDELACDVATQASDPLSQVSARELICIVNDEILRLPSVYQLPVILCCLEGMTQEEAARQLSWTPGSVRGRLERGRAQLRARLTRRGWTLPAALAVFEVSHTLAHAGLSIVLTKATVKAALTFAKCQGLVVTGVGNNVVQLAEYALEGATFSATKLAAVIVLTLGMVIVTAGSFFEGPGDPKNKQDPPAPFAAGKTEGERKQGATGVDLNGDALPMGAVARLGTLRFRQDAPVNSVAYSPDGKLLASSEWFRRAHLWDAESGKKLATFPVRADAVEFSPDGTLLATFNGFRAKVVLWDVQTRKIVREMVLGEVHRDAPNEVCRFSSDGRLLVATSGPYAFVLDVASGKQLARIGNKAFRINDAVFAPDNKALAVACGKSGIQIWEIEAQKLVRHIGSADVLSLAYAPDGKILAAAAHDKRILYDPITGDEIRTIDEKLLLSDGLAFTADGKGLICGFRDGKVGVWNLMATKPRRHVHVSLSPERSIAVSRDGARLALGTWASQAHTIAQFNLKTGAELFREVMAHKGQINALSISPDGKTLVSGGESNQVHLWDLTNNKHIQEDGGYTPIAVRFLPDGRHSLWAPRWGTEMFLCDRVTRERVRKFAIGENANGGQHMTFGLALSEDGKTAVTGMARWIPGPDYDSPKLCVWNVDTGQRVREIPLRDSIPKCMAPTFPSGLVAWSYQGKIWLYDLHSNQVRLCVQSVEPDAAAIAFSKNGQLLITAGGLGFVSVWEASTGQRIRSFKAHDHHVGALAVAADGRTIASADGSFEGNDKPRAIKFFDIYSGQELGQVPNQDSDIRALSFTPDGKRLVAGYRNTSNLVWDLQGVLAKPMKPATSPSRQELEMLWQELGQSEAANAYAAIATLIKGANGAASFLKDRLPPAKPLDGARFSQMLVDLDSPTFAQRDKASRDLQKLGPQAQPAIRQAIANTKSLETRRRLEKLANYGLADFPETLCRLRAIQVLELIGSAECVRALQGLASGDPDAPETHDASLALKRLKSVQTDQ
ncbi:MAG: sigma-70 family RNA polymerase sigma factor [Planctomycetes bacterium]|nr:sigma-70 family RNA polymerase sigma factor [Planctomycetota bacterium]